MLFNLYYTPKSGVGSCIQGLTMEYLLANVKLALLLGDEITGIINVEDDK